MRAPELLGGRYELRGVLGRGGMAEVRDGWDTRLARPVAIKILHPVIDSQQDNRKRFEAEARAAARLNSSHIVAVHDSGEHNGMPFIVMERLTGGSLHDKIAAGPLPPRLVRAVLDDVLAALATAHDGGILHRDIKPANILFTPSGEAKVSDFGLAKTAQMSLTATGQLFGTMAYLSPDRVLGKPGTAADDVYAVGVVGYEALTGRPPFVHENLAALAHAILNEVPPPIAALRPDADPPLVAVVDRAMARDPAVRFHSAPAMRAALAGRTPVAPGTRVLDAPLPPVSVAPSPASGRYPRSAIRGPSRRGKLLALAAVFAAMLLALILVLFDSAQTGAPMPVTTSTTVPPPTTGAPFVPPSTPSFAETPPDVTPPGHKHGKKPKPGRGNNGNNGRGND